MTQTIGQTVPNFNDSAFFPMVFNGLIPLRTTVFGTVWLRFNVLGYGFGHGLRHVLPDPLAVSPVPVLPWRFGPAQTVMAAKLAASLIVAAQAEASGRELYPTPTPRNVPDFSRREGAKAVAHSLVRVRPRLYSCQNDPAVQRGT
jgi:hypothetical protein